MKPTSLVLTAALLASGAGAFFPAAGNAQATPSASPSATADAAASAVATFSVDTNHFAYSPTPLTIPAGSTVVFKNSDSVAHTVTAADASFDSKNMDKGQTWSHVFANAGTYDYVCAYHAFMKGQVIVK